MDKNKFNKRQIQAQNTRNKIYFATVELMEEKGFGNITVEEICSRSGASVGSLYNCFKSKNDILNEIYRVADDYFNDIVANGLKEGSFYERIVWFFKYYADYNAERGLDFMKQLYNSQNKIFVTKGRHMQSVLQTIIEEGQKNGEVLGDMGAREIVEYLFIAVRGVVYDWCLHEGKYDLSEFVVNYVKRLVKIFIVG